MLSLGFTLFLYILEEALFKRQMIYLFWELSKYVPSYRLKGIVAIALSFFALFIFIWGSLASNYRWRIVYFVVFAIAVLVEFNFWNMFQRFMTSYDLSTAFYSPPQLWLDAASLFFSWVGLFPILVYLAILAVYKRQQQGSATFFVVFLMIVGINSFIYYMGYEKSPAISVQDFLKTLTATAWSGWQEPYVREEVTFRSDKELANNVVLIIDETIRGDHFSLNGYHRATTPYLDELAAEGYIDNWGVVASASSCSWLSNAAILMGLAKYPDDEHRAAQNPSLFQYAKAMGYTTYYFDAQTDILWNGLVLSDLTYVDHWINSATLGNDLNNDLRAAEQVYQITAHSKGNFILINKKGIHFYYDSVYPAENRIWEPVGGGREYSDANLVINSYDNGLHYNINHFFQQLIPDPANLNSTVYVYTGDHGETLAEDGANWPHCGPTRNEAAVPLFLIGNERPVDTSYKASHYNIFATVLDLMEVPKSARLYTYPLSLFEATTEDSQDRFFIDAGGAVINYDALMSPP